MNEEEEKLKRRGAPQLTTQ